MFMNCLDSVLLANKDNVTWGPFQKAGLVRTLACPFQKERLLGKEHRVSLGLLLLTEPEMAWLCQVCKALA